jgi:hypothetical protein
MLEPQEIKILRLLFFRETVFAIEYFCGGQFGRGPSLQVITGSQIQPMPSTGKTAQREFPRLPPN